MFHVTQRLVSPLCQVASIMRTLCTEYTNNEAMYFLITIFYAEVYNPVPHEKSYTSYFSFQQLRSPLTIILSCPLKDLAPDLLLLK
jgi:hypothetical protein